MSRPLAANGYPLADNAWAIHDAQLFYVGDSETFHRVSRFPAGNRVSGKCGVWAITDDAHTRQATWASGYNGTPCQTCKDRS